MHIDGGLGQIENFQKAQGSPISYRLTVSVCTKAGIAMKAFANFLICLACLISSAVAHEPIATKAENTRIEEADGKSGQNPLADRMGSETQDQRCWPLRTVGIAESAKDYYESCK